MRFSVTATKVTGRLSIGQRRYLANAKKIAEDLQSMAKDTSGCQVDPRDEAFIKAVEAYASGRFDNNGNVTMERK